MEREAPVVRLVYVVLLSADKKRATKIRIGRNGERAVVEFLIDGVVHEEMELPVRFHAPAVRRLSVMASLPVYPAGQAAEGFLRIVIGDDGARTLDFKIRVQGHGAELEAWLAKIETEPAG